MSGEPIFERQVMSGQHVITSPDLPGFMVSAPTAQEAEQLLPRLLAKYLELSERKIAPMIAQPHPNYDFDASLKSFMERTKSIREWLAEH